MEKAIASGDSYGIPELVKTGALFRLAPGTLVQIIDRDDNGLINDTIEINRMFTEHVDRMAQICGSCADAVDSPEPVHADPAGISLKVRILSGPATGRSGWVRATQVVLPAKMPGAAPGATTAKQ
jgi:hypothetical protein